MKLKKKKLFKILLTISVACLIMLAYYLFLSPRGVTVMRGLCNRNELESIVSYFSDIQSDMINSSQISYAKVILGDNQLYKSVYVNYEKQWKDEDISGSEVINTLSALNEKYGGDYFFSIAVCDYFSDGSMLIIIPANKRLIDSKTQTRIIYNLVYYNGDKIYTDSAEKDYNMYTEVIENGTHIFGDWYVFSEKDSMW